MKNPPDSYSNLPDGSERFHRSMAGSLAAWNALRGGYYL
jgi:hypothetical protein